MLFAGAASVHAVSLGPIQLLSGLDQPLRATIPLSIDATNDLGSACVRARLELSDGTFISTPRISLTHNAQTGVIELSTKQSVNEPAVILHVEMGCGTAIYRNYQLLLDPVRGRPTTYPQRAADIPSTLPQRQARAEMPAKVKADTKTHHDQFNARKSEKGNTAKVVQLPTFTKEMSLSSEHSNIRTQHHASLSPNDAKWIPEDSITPVLKLSAGLADPNTADDAHKTEEFKAAQMRFAAIVGGEDVTQNAEEKMKAAQEKMLRLQEENAQKKQQAELEKLSQDEKRKVSFPITWFAGLSALLLMCLAVIAWIISRLIKAKKSSTSHPWKNYNAASDTLIADLSTQTLLDSEFLNTVGDSYNTAVFSDTQFDQDSAIEDDDFEDPLEEDESYIAEPIETNSSFVALDSHEAENKTVEKSAVPKASTPATSEPVASESSHPPKTDIIAKTNNSQIEAPAAVLLPTQPPKPAVKVVQQEDHNNTNTASAPIARPAPATPVAPASTPKKSKEAAPTLNVKEVADIMQQAEFWMLLQDPFRAIEILEPYRDVAQPESPVPWIYLLDLYRMVGDKTKYELLLVRIEYVFNAKIPRWDGQFGITPRTLNDYPHVVEKICALWETDEITSYLESLLLDKRDGARQGFDLPVYRNIVQLITLAREPDQSKEHEQLRYGKAQAILFSQQPNPVQAAPTVTSKPAENAAINTSAKTEPVRNDSALDTESHTSNDLNQTTVEAAPVIAATNIGSENTSLLNEQPINTVSSHSQVEEGDEEEANDPVEFGDASPMDTKLELALAYQEIGEKDGARELLYEVIKDGSPDQSEKAKSILKEMN
jgi:FimV-like protein